MPSLLDKQLAQEAEKQADKLIKVEAKKKKIRKQK